MVLVKYNIKKIYNEHNYNYVRIWNYCAFNRIDFRGKIVYTNK